MENGSCMFSSGSYTNYIACRIIMEDAVSATVYRIRTRRNDKIEARAKFRVHIICIRLSIIGHYGKMTIKLQLLLDSSRWLVVYRFFIGKRRWFLCLKKQQGERQDTKKYPDNIGLETSQWQVKPLHPRTNQCWDEYIESCGILKGLLVRSSTKNRSNAPCAYRKFPLC